MTFSVRLTNWPNKYRINKTKWVEVILAVMKVQGSTALQFQDGVTWRTGNMLIAAKHKKAAHNAFTTCQLQKESDVCVPDLVIYQHKLADQTPWT